MVAIGLRLVIVLLTFDVHQIQFINQSLPLEQAERTVHRAINSPRAELRIFTAEEGGAEHVGGDLFSPSIDYIADWTAEVLLPKA